MTKSGATREALDSRGVFHTGDIGKPDSEGLLTSPDPKNGLSVTAGGKIIAPQVIEGKLKTNAYIAGVVAVGYHTSMSSVRSGVPAKLPFGGVGRVPSTTCSVREPTPCGPRVAKSAV